MPSCALLIDRVISHHKLGYEKLNNILFMVPDQQTVDFCSCFVTCWLSLCATDKHKSFL